jgi:2-keto-3-deoxy-L-rhamnonate aldolase RhmA
VPGVEDAACCAAAVAAAKYPPVGRRGFGPRRTARLDGGRPAYLARADEEIAVLVMIESADAVADIDAILKTPGLDGIMVGPADLAVTMGHLRNLGHPEVRTAITAVRDASQRQSVPFGIFAGTPRVVGGGGAVHDHRRGYAVPRPGHRSVANPRADPQGVPLAAAPSARPPRA